MAVEARDLADVAGVGLRCFVMVVGRTLSWRW
jgi:hypothetical protein